MPALRYDGYGGDGYDYDYGYDDDPYTDPRGHGRHHGSGRRMPRLGYGGGMGGGYAGRGTVPGSGRQVPPLGYGGEGGGRYDGLNPGDAPERRTRGGRSRGRYSTELDPVADRYGEQWRYRDDGEYDKGQEDHDLRDVD